MKIITYLITSVFILTFSFAQQKSFEQKSELILDELNLKVQNKNNYQSLDKILTNWIIVDTLPNSLSPASLFLNPIAYDQSSDALIFVHRGAISYAQSSGEIWYNISTNHGDNWSRVAAINNNLNLSGRYPNAAILNPNDGGLSQTKGVFSWAHLNSPTFLGSGIGKVDPLGSNNSTANYDSTFSNTVLWTYEDWTFWAGSSLNGYKVARTSDFTNIEYNLVLDENINVLSLGGVGFNGNQYLGFLGTFPDPNPANPIYSGWYPAYSKSTDNGVTWNTIVVDFRTVLPNYDRLFDFIKNDDFISYAGDMNVDKDGYVHFILSATDTTSNNNTGINSIVEIFETASGWNGTIIYEGIDDNAFTTREGPAVGQMGPSGYLAFDKNREQMASVWVANSPTSAQGLCDVYISWRNVYSTHWLTPINLTMTDNMNENGIHLATQLFFDSGFSYKAFVGYFYELGYFGPDPNNFSLTGFWVTANAFTYTDVSDEDINAINFSISQNFPNPFNPSTKIKFSIPNVTLSGVEGSRVKLKVYDVLGNEVATLINEYRNAGSYEVDFNAASLASGIYFYKLQAGSFIQTKKMILLK